MSTEANNKAPQLSFEDRILRATATNSNDLPDFPDDKSDLPSDFEYNPADYDDDEEEVVEEITESELLKYLDEQEDPLNVAQRLFYHELNSTASQKKSDSWNLKHLTPESVEELYSCGWTELEGLIDLDILRGAHEEAAGLLEKDAFISPKDTKNSSDDPFRHTTARDDVILWMGQNDNQESHTISPPSNLRKIMDFIENSLFADISKMIRLNGQKEYQLSYYHSDGARYERHRDALPTDDSSNKSQRRVTVVLYLNPGWVSGDGGEVRIFSRKDDHGLPSGADRLVHPLLGKILLSLSGVVDYEILAAKKSRFALTAWMR